MLILIVFLVLLLIQIPISLVLGMTSLTYMGNSGDWALIENVPQRLFAGVDSYSLLAVPLFMLAGELMNSAGITRQLIDLSKKFLGHFRGGLAYVNVIANMFLASILGSATAQTAMMTRVMVPEMEKEGYTREFAAATTAASALLGPIIPPSMLFIIYSVGSSVSVGRMFMAGILPGIVLAGSFMILIAFMGYKYNFPRSKRSTVKQAAASFFRALPSLMVPIIIVGGIFSGVFTATESAGVACLLAIILGAFVTKDLKWRLIPRILSNAAISTSAVTLLLAMANVFGWVLAFDQIPQKMVQMIGTLTSSPYVFLLMVNVFLLVVGIIMDEMAVLIVLLPILMPLVAQFQIDPVHFGVLICMNATVGLLHPPVGAVIFIGSSVGEVKYERLSVAVIPFLVVALIVLFVVTYIPWITTWLPNLIYG